MESDENVSVLLHAVPKISKLGFQHPKGYKKGGVFWLV